MSSSIEQAVAEFGREAKGKLRNPGAGGQPEDQLRAPFEGLLRRMAELANVRGVHAVGESAIGELKTRPDYAVTVGNVLVGFVELKAPGKGADPRRFTDKHDQEQWKRLRSLPNLMYTDGNAWSLWQNGELAGQVLRMDGDVERDGEKLAPPLGFAVLFEIFLRWQPIAPRSARELAETTARLCRLLRDEVAEQLGRGNPAFTGLGEDWRKLLSPEADDATFADGYAQTVTFGLLMARAKGIELKGGMGRVAEELGQTSSLIGAALRLLTDSPENRAALRTALGALERVLDVVNWEAVSRGSADAWLYFYEQFLEVYDNKLRKQTGSYYTPPEVVAAMVGLVDEALRSSRYQLHGGLASRQVTLVDPATGTGTFFLGVLQRIAATVRADAGEGAVAGEIGDALKRLAAFEMQLGPFAVAQLRILAEVVSLTGAVRSAAPRLFVTNTLGDPQEEAGYFPQMLAPLANQRKAANKIMREEPVTVILGNPPYKEKAKGRGGWIEAGARNTTSTAPLLAWMPGKELGAHAKHLRNLYVYFWRWATWKVFEQGPGAKQGVVCFITVAGFLGGPGFSGMRAYLRERCDEVWVIDCSPEGHQPEVNTRIFQGVQQPVCIVMASRSGSKKNGVAAKVRWRALPLGRREEKFAALAGVHLDGDEWVGCPALATAPFLPETGGAWGAFPKLETLFNYNGSGVQPKRVWVIAPDSESLIKRWRKLIASPIERKEALFHATLRDGVPADRHIRSVVREVLPGFAPNLATIAEEKADCAAPVRYAFRSFNRQWIIPDNRVITQPNAELWSSRSKDQVYLTALSRTSPRNGPALTFAGSVPDLDHYRGSFGGRVFPLWRDQDATEPNIRAGLLRFLTEQYGRLIGAKDVMAYIAAVAAHPAYIARFQEELRTPGLRIPITADAVLFAEAAKVGRRVLWVHTFGERLASTAEARPYGPPRLPEERRPTIPKEGAIPETKDEMPDTLGYDAGKQRLLVGSGFINRVTAAMWAYEVSGKNVLAQWFSYRKRNRERPIIGDRRQPSPLGDIQPEGWLPEYTAELLNVLNVLGLLIELEPEQSQLLERLCAGPLISEGKLKTGGAFESSQAPSSRSEKKSKLPQLFSA